MSKDKIMLCPECDLLLKPVPAQEGLKILCPRCGGVLDAPKKNSVEKVLALTSTGMLLYAPALFLPLLTFDAAGLESTGSIVDSCLALFHTGFYFTGLMVFLTAVFIPLVKLLVLFTVAGMIYTGRSTRKTAVLFRYYHHMDEWGMLEVYMIGVLVTIIKMLHMAKVEYDVGFYCFIGLLTATLASTAVLDKKYFWRKIDLQASEREKATGISSCAKKETLKPNTAAAGAHG